MDCVPKKKIEVEAKNIDFSPTIKSNIMFHKLTSLRLTMFLIFDYLLENNIVWT